MALLLGCGSRAAEKPAAPPGPSFSGRIEGVIRLAPNAELPLAADPHAQGPSVVEPPAPCSPFSAADRTLLALGEGRTLADIHVALTDMKHTPPSTPRTHHVVFDDCRARPKVIAAQRGDSLHLRNPTQLTLLPTLSGESFMEALLPQQERALTLERKGALVLRCSLGAYCGRAEVLVAAHPLFALSDAAGHFVVSKVPLDEPVTVHAYHPSLGTTQAKVKLTQAQPVARLELVMPAPAPPKPAAAAPPADGVVQGQ